MDLKEITEEYMGALKYVKEIKREISLRQAPDIVALLGPRRVGKTFLMLKKVKTLLENRKQALYISFDEPGLREVKARKLAELAKKAYPEGRINLFLDEVQEWKDWDANLRWLHDVKDFYIFVSGSSSALYSSEIPYRLRGRYLSKLVLPISFGEIINFELKTFRERGKMFNLLEKYLRWGGFPEVWLYKSREKIVSILETVFYRDIAEKFRVKGLEDLQEVFYFVLANYSNRMTYNSLKRTFSSLGVNIDTKTIIKYIRAIESSFLAFVVEKFSYSVKERMVSPKKIYLIDTCFAHLFEKTLDIGRKMENIVFIELLRRGFKVNYYMDKKGNEIDFLASKNGEKHLLEVTYEDTEEKKKTLREAMKRFKIRTSTIVTWDTEETIRDDGRMIKVIPLWKWLLHKT